MPLDHSTTAIHTSHSGNQHGSVRSHFVQLLGKQSSWAIHDPKSTAARIERSVCIHQACLYLRWSQDMQQYSNLAWTDTRSHGGAFPTLPLLTRSIDKQASLVPNATPVVQNQFLSNEHTHFFHAQYIYFKSTPSFIFYFY